MENEELKEKMVKIIINAIWKDAEADYDSTDESEAISIADALIEAGYGDVKEAEAEANRYEMLYKLQNRDMALAERRAHDAEHRAERAEKALKLACYDKARTYFPNVPNEEYENRRDKYYCEYVEKSEKELVKDGKNYD